MFSCSQLNYPFKEIITYVAAKKKSSSSLVSYMYMIFGGELIPAGHDAEPGEFPSLVAVHRSGNK